MVLLGGNLARGYPLGSKKEIFFGKSAETIRLFSGDFRESDKKTILIQQVFIQQRQSGPLRVTLEALVLFCLLQGSIQEPRWKI